MRRALIALSLLIAAAAVALLAGGRSTVESDVCDRVASPSGSDSNPGTLDRPFATFSALANALAPGDTGCLRGDGRSFRADQFTIDDPGIEIRSSPSERAVLAGRIYAEGSAAGSTLSGVDIDLAGMADVAVGIQVNADDFSLVSSSIVDDHNQICVSTGADDPRFGLATGVTIADDRITGCGKPGNNFEQGIYVNGADRNVIERNRIEGSAARGIQLYGDADGTLIRNNLILRNGQGIGLGSRNGGVPDDTMIEGNVIAGSVRGPNISAALDPGVRAPSGNVVRGNCLWAGPGEKTGGVEAEGGFSLAANLIEDPRLRQGEPSADCALDSLASTR